MGYIQIFIYFKTIISIIKIILKRDFLLETLKKQKYNFNRMCSLTLSTSTFDYE